MKRTYLLLLVFLLPMLACTVTIDLTPTPAPITPPPTASPLPPPPSSETLTVLQETILPVHDPYEFKRRMEGVVIPPTLPGPDAPRQVGEQDWFWVNNDRETLASLRYVTDHAYFWIESGMGYNPADLEALAITFETLIYPETRAFFGSEWNPGVDGDPHIYIVYSRQESNSGSFAPYAELNPLLDEYSDAHEIIFLGADSSRLNDDYTYGVLAHEFQHVIHYQVDRNEESWLEEGLSELAAYRFGYDLGGFDAIFARNPDYPMTVWPEDGETSAYYGSGALMMIYFLDRFGEDATRALIADPRNGLQSIDGTLTDLHITDPLTGQPITADDFILDFALAVYLQDASIADGRYALDTYPVFVQASDTETVTACPSLDNQRQVSQYGIDYIGITCPGNYTLRFQGNTTAPLVPAAPHSGAYAMWSNRGVNSEMSLSCTFDLTAASAPLTLTFWTWYDIENSYDNVYLTAWAGGDTWTNLLGSVDAAYTGAQTTWQQRSVDLSAFAGQVTQVRFDYITDGSINREGFLLDDIAIPEIGYHTDFETGSDCWQAAGFARVQTTLPQTYKLALITRTAAGTAVQAIPLNADQSAQIPLQLAAGEKAVLVVIGTTRYTTQPATYQFSIAAP
jgi:immune inhibitor A